MFEFMLILLSLFVFLGLWFFVWIGLDWYDARKHHRKQMSMPHYHHMLLGLWPFLTVYLALSLFDQVPELAVLLFIVLTSLLYFFSALWDIHYRKVHLGELRLLDPYTSSPLLFRLATSYPTLTIVFACCGFLGALGILMNDIFVFPDLIKLSIVTCLWVGVVLILYRMRKKAVTIWQRKNTERG